jgi:hypothetical protein
MVGEALRFDSIRGAPSSEALFRIYQDRVVIKLSTRGRLSGPISNPPDDALSSEDATVSNYFSCRRAYDVDNAVHKPDR